MTENNPLTILGVPSSQPTRAVIWPCLLKELPIELSFSADAEYYTSVKFAKLNPARKIPVLIDGDFIVYEMPAILTYLSDKHGWSDLYPQDLKGRTVINAYLSNHVTFTRQATLKLMAPHVAVVKDGGIGDDEGSIDPSVREAVNLQMKHPEMFERGTRIVGRIVKAINDTHFQPGSDFMFGRTSVSIADIACYEELRQLETSNLFDYSPHRNVLRWFEAMQALPHHDALHSYNQTLGDIRTEPATMERYSAALMNCFRTLQAAGVQVKPIT